MATAFEEGLLVGLLMGEGHFGGDGRQPQVTLRMHVRHEAIFRWIQATFVGGKLYGPYHHDGRHYYQWMARGRFLHDTIVPLCDRALSPTLDEHSYQRYAEMKRRYAAKLGPSAPDPPAAGHAVAGRNRLKAAPNTPTLASPPPAKTPLSARPAGGDETAGIFAELRQAAAPEPG